VVNPEVEVASTKQREMVTLQRHKKLERCWMNFHGGEWELCKNANLYSF
jgi:hypothetical protein